MDEAISEVARVKSKIADLEQREAALKENADALQKRANELREERKRLSEFLCAATLRRLEGVVDAVRICRLIRWDGVLLHPAHVNNPATVVKVAHTQALLRFSRLVGGEAEWTFPISQIRVTPDAAAQLEIEPFDIRRAREAEM